MVILSNVMSGRTDMYDSEEISRRRKRLLIGVICGFLLGIAAQNLLILRIYFLVLGLLQIYNSYESVCVFEWDLKQYILNMDRLLMHSHFSDLNFPVAAMEQREEEEK